MKEKRFVIWSNDIDQIECIAKDMMECNPDLEYDEAIRQAYELNDDYLGDERTNLDIELHREIIAIGDLGLWNGRASGYKEIKGTNVNDCLDTSITCGDYLTWYVDELGDLRCNDVHHDGTNYYMFRVFKPGLTWLQKANFKYNVYCRMATRRDINRYTERLGDHIANVYGFRIRKKPVRKAVA